MACGWMSHAWRVAYRAGLDLALVRIALARGEHKLKEVLVVRWLWIGVQWAKGRRVHVSSPEKRGGKLNRRGVDHVWVVVHGGACWWVVGCGWWWVVVGGGGGVSMRHVGPD